MIFFGQMLGGQRGPEARLPGAAAVLLPNQAQDLFAKSVRLGAVGGTTGTAVLQPRSPFEPVTPPQTLGLPVTQREHLRGIDQTQRPTPHLAEHLDASQLLRAHGCPFHGNLLQEVAV